MNEIVRIMSALFPFFVGHDEPLVYQEEDQNSNGIGNYHFH